MSVSVTLSVGNAQSWFGAADLVLTNPYAPLPACLKGTPTIIGHLADRKAACEDWVGSDLIEVSSWGRGLRCRVWVARMLAKYVDLSDLVEDEEVPGRGWFPLALPVRLLSVYGHEGCTVWDGFCGRGTVGKACTMLGMNFIGIDRDPARIELARRYIGC